MQTARVLDLDKIKIDKGGHSGPDDGYCVMEAVAWIAGEPWSDAPKCASGVIGAFMRKWNDSLNDTDRQMLKPYVRKLVGTAASAEVEEHRAYMVIDWFIRVHTPAWLELAKLSEHAAAVRALPEVTDLASLQACGATLEEARRSAAAAGAAAWDAAWDAAEDAAGAAAGAAARAAAGAAAWAAAWAAAGDAAWAAAWAAAWDAAGDAAGAAAGAAAWKILRPTVETLQKSALELIDRLIEVK
jgi:hypothetical protein